MKTLLLTLAVLLFVRPTLAQDFAGHTRDILVVKFNPDATQLISYSAADGWLCLWEVRGGRLLWRAKTEFIQKGNEHYRLTSFAFSPDRQLIASGSANGTVQLWDAKTGKILWRADAHAQNVTAVEFSLDGKTIASAASPDEGDDEIKLLRVEDGQIIQRLEGKPCTVVAMKFDDANLLRTGNLDGAVSQWKLKTGKQSVSARCRTRTTYGWETSFTPDLKISAVRTGPRELTLTDTQTDTVTKQIQAEAFRVYSRLSADGNKVIVSGYGGFTFHDFTTGHTRKIEEFSRTGSTIDLSQDGSLFAEGGSYGDAAIKITETQTGNSWIIGRDLTAQRIPPYQLSELQIRLTKEKQQRQAILDEAKARRDKQAALDAESFKKQVYISFDHYGDMTNPGEQRMLESGEPNKSRLKKTASEATAIWLRLHNDSPLPIKILTYSMYLRNEKCFYQAPAGEKLFGLCNDTEINLWHGLEDKNGKPIPFGFDFGSTAFLLPKTSAVFAVPREVLKNGNAIRFFFTFQKETEDKKMADYGKDVTLKFRESDLPTER